MNNLAIAYDQDRSKNRENSIENSIKAHLDVLSVRTQAKMPELWADTMNNLGAAFVSRRVGERAQNIEAAIGYYKASLEVRKKNTLPHDWASSQFNLANAYRQREIGTKSDNIERAIELYKNALEVRRPDIVPLDFIYTQKGLAEAFASRIVGEKRHNSLQQLEAYNAAIAAVDQLIGTDLDAQQVMVAMTAAGEIFRSAALIYVENGNIKDGLILAERGRTRLLQLAFRVSTLVSTLPQPQKERFEELRGAANAIQSQLSRPVVMSASSVRDVSLAARQQKLRDRLDVIRNEISNMLPKVASADRIPSVPEGGAVILPLVSKYGAVAFVISKSGVDAVKLPDFNNGRMKDLFVGSDTNKEGGWSGAYSSIATAEKGTVLPTKTWISEVSNFQYLAGSLIIGPIIEHLESLNIKPGSNIIMICQDYLARMPLNMARDPRSGKLFSDLYNLSYAPNLASLTEVFSPRTISIGAWFNEKANPDLQFTSLISNFLVRSVKEIELISSDDAQKPDTLLDKVKKYNVSIIWTHGAFDSRDVRRTGLQLASPTKTADSQMLEVQDIMNTSFVSGKPQLVVLLACESGIADVEQNDELISLPTALVYAGARGAISALWPVREDATMLFMAKLAQLIFTDNEPAWRALSIAARWLRESTREELIAFVNDNIDRGKIVENTEKSYDLLMSSLEHIEPGNKPYADPYFWAAFYYTGSHNLGREDYH